MQRLQAFKFALRPNGHRVQKIHPNIANARLDFLHKATTTICKNHTVDWVSLLV